MIVTNEILTNRLLEDNRNNYNIMKTLEEATELNEKLLKYLNKKPEYKPKDEDIIEEIGDLYVRLAVLTKQFGEEAIQERINKKSETLFASINRGQYKGGV